MTTTIFKAPTIHCSSCVMLLEGIEDELPGVQEVRASLKNQEVAVTYDESVVSEAAIIKAARSEGYDLIPHA